MRAMNVYRHVFSKKAICLSHAKYVAVPQYSGCMALFFYDLKSFTHPEILGHIGTKKLISLFLKIYGDGLLSPQLKQIKPN
jgi:hypothetical protein